MSADEALSSVASHALTWLAANGSSIGGVLLWVTKPLREKLTVMQEALDKLEKRLGDVEGHFGEPRSPRASMVDIAGPAELTRRVQTLEHDFRELQAQMNRTVSDEEFRGYITVASQKGEKLLETLAFIRGRLKYVRTEDD